MWLSNKHKIAFLLYSVSNSPIDKEKSLQIKKSNDLARYIIVTQDVSLREAARQIPGTPVLYLHFKAPTLERPSSYSEDKAKSDIDSRYTDKFSQLKSLFAHFQFATITEFRLQTFT